MKKEKIMSRPSSYNNLRSAKIMILLVILLIRAGSAQTPNESEPNDHRDQANEIHLGESVKGHFHKRGDYDWFK